MNSLSSSAFRLPFLSRQISSNIASVLKTAFPIFLNYESIALIGLVDIQLAGLLGTPAQTAVGLGDQLLYLTSTAASGLSVATCAITARYFGANQNCKLLNAIKVSLLASTVCGVLAMVLGLTASHLFINIFSNDPAVTTYGARYIQLCAYGSLPFVVSIVVSSIFRSIDKVIYSLYLWLATSGVTIVLSYVLFYSNTSFTHSLDALCVAWDIGAYVGLILGLFLLKRQARQFPSNQNHATGTSDSRYQRRLLRLVLLMGSAIAIAESSTLFSDFLIYKVISYMNDATALQAAWTIFLKVEESFAIMPISAVALALAATVGQLIGKGSYEQARACTKILAISSTVIFTICGATLLALPNLIEFLSHAEQSVVASSVSLLAFIPIFFPLLAIRVLLFAFLEGSGQTSAPMKLSLLGNSIKVALGAVLAITFSMGLSGLTIAIVLSRTFMAIGSIKAFGLGRRATHGVAPITEAVS